MLRSVLTALTIALSSSTALAADRIALVMGADDYEFMRPLDNAVNDARAVEKALEALGFEVILETDRDLKRMRRALDDFREEAEGAKVALVFFAGHGVEIGGENRLLPTDANGASLDELKQTTLPLEEVRAAIADVAPIGLIMLDACRNDPFGTAGGGGRGAVSIAPQVLTHVEPGLGRMGKSENVLFAFSAAPGETASDGEGNSPFTTALAKYLGTEGLEIRSVLTLVQQEVYDVSRGTQLPYVESGLPELFFAAGPTGPLPERERLLLAMADVTPDIRLEVEQVATDAGMPLAPLYGALLESDAASMTGSDRLAKLHEAAAAFVKVREDLKTMASSDPAVERLRNEAEEQLALGAFDTARARLTEAADIDSRSREALKTNLVERTLSEAATRYVAGGAAKAELRYDLAISDLEKATALYAEAGDAALAPEHADRRLSSLFNLADMYVTVGTVEKAARTYETLLVYQEKRVEIAGADQGPHRDLAIVHMKLGDLRETQGNLAEALEHFEASRDIMEKVTAVAPDDALYQSDLAVALDEIADTLILQGQLVPAIQTYTRSLGIKEALLAKRPNSTSAQRDVTVTYEALAAVMRDLGQTKDALWVLKESLAMRQAIVAADPSHDGHQRDLSISYDKMGDILRDTGDLDGALKAYKDGRAIVEALAVKDPGNTQYRRDIGVSSDKIGNVLDDQGDLDGALAAYAEGLEIVSALAASDWNNTTWSRDMTVSLEKNADVLLRKGDVDGALAHYDDSLNIMRTLVARDPTNIEWQRDLSITLSAIGNIRVDQRQLEPAVDALREALDLSEKVAATAPGNARWQRDLVIALANWAQVGPKKRQTLQRALDIMIKLRIDGQAGPNDPRMISHLEQRLARLKG